MNVYKSQALQDISIRIHSIKDDGTDNTGDAANLSTIILDPAGNELIGTTNYTEATFDEIGTTGVYECLFPTTAPVDVFTSVDQDNPYTINLISSTGSIGSSSKTIRIVSVYPWENALEATLDEIKGVGWTDETLKEIMAAVLTRLASTPFVSAHPPATVTVTDGTVESGDVSSIQSINQTYLKVQESGKFKIDTTYTGVDEEHERFYVTYRYFGTGTANHKIEMQMWNYTTSAWDNVVSMDRDLPATNIDTTLIFTIEGTLSDYYNGTIPNLTAQLRIFHESNATPEHRFWLDAIGLGDLEIIYPAPDNATIEEVAETTTDILDQITGTGNRVITIHVEDVDTNPLQDVLVRIGEASQTTDVSGDAVFALDDGDYDVILRKNFVSFTVPEALTVAGDGTHNFTGTLIMPSAPTQPDTCVVFGYVIDDGGNPVENAEILINETDDSTFANTQKVVLDKETTSDANGFWELEVIRSSELDPAESPYEAIITYGDTGFRFVTSITVPDADSVEFSTIVNT